MGKYRYIAPCMFGLEGILSGEVKRMGGEEVEVTDGKVEFSGDYAILARANLTLRTAERVLIKLGEFEAKTFDELFEGTKKIPFEEFIGKHDAFPIKGYSLHSELHSVPDCQKIIKKATVEHLKGKYGISWFEETGALHQIQFSILRDKATIMLDTSGAGLHKRGYRKNSNEAPIKETLAAGMIDLARVKKDTTFYDPFCGSGTLLIEAAMKALNIPSGIGRKFACQHWDCISESFFREERARGLDLIHRDATFMGYGSDIDSSSVELALNNASKAKVASKVRIRIRDVKDFNPISDKGVLVTNPPYGERLLNISKAHEIYKTMGKVFSEDNGISYYIISPDEDFENIFGRKAQKRRKLYNGMLKCQLFMYY